jgi:hypothetical protein
VLMLMQLVVYLYARDRALWGSGLRHLNDIRGYPQIYVQNPRASLRLVGRIRLQ